ncbi:MULTISPECIES: hypothetical protein [Mycobacterium avium complex (MAC)]|uniref:Mce protein n=1 Tax=Mycobacterium arosiense ATCC BAA-1401 = DSM 45069 TaxID=1265311 RepID=A0A1W9ZIP2_MYCAI|nr:MULTISPECIES: hypothetical protein [Mycobacterium avium complex (MAC)]ORA15678.1 hypothetical protein BST14_11545 [Mycobacterium arosiense ATCC BAA-1401 = DSM 45069]
MAEHARAAESLNESPPEGQAAPVDEETHADDDGTEAISDPATDDAAVREDDGDDTTSVVAKRFSSITRPVALIAAAMLALIGVVGWLGYRTYEDGQTREQRNQLVEAARQGVVNLTTIDYTKADADIKRILDMSTGTFHDDFQRRSQPFMEVVKQAQSKSEGRVTEAGVESQHGNQAQVLVTVSVKMSNAGAPEQEPRAWRMRISVDKVNDIPKISDVQFVP